jgi:hypothetical protein
MWEAFKKTIKTPVVIFMGIVLAIMFFIEYVW